MDAAGGSQAGDSSELSSPSSSGGGEQVYVAVGGSKAMVLWALHKFPKDTAFVLLHVCSQPKLIPIMGARIPARQVQEQELTSYKKMELQRINDSLDQHLLLCAQEKVQAEKLVVESDDVAEGLVQLITEHHVTALVMGAAADKHYTKKMKALKSKKAQVVEQRADPSCKIWYICKGTLVYRRLFPLAMGQGRKVHKSLVLNSFQWIDQLACQRCGVFQIHGYTNQISDDPMLMKRKLFTNLMRVTINSSICSGSWRV
uniref:RING-type E3 ubiquitin transferase n=1 Tax=Aegilops tauschii subsp. strangulata TaxID=200361 RepID=A0A453PSC1_AEGTS